MSKDILLIFARNLIYGKVKTRLATTIGHNKALAVYQSLIKHTAAVTKSIDVTRFVYYSDFITNGDAWDNTYLKTVQQGTDLGERMSNAFNDALKHGHKKAIIIGTDCYELSAPVITEAFEQLNSYDIVIGPALDGGYYLLGMNKHHPALFDDMVWSTDTVLGETVKRCDQLGLRYFLLPVLADIDEEKDLLTTGILQKL